MYKDKFEKAEINFELDGKTVEFVVYHNLKYFGLDIMSAFINWFYRTKKHTVISFCMYVMSKNQDIICLDEKNFMEQHGT